MPSEAGMEEIHQDILILLKKFHKLCVDNNIKYSLHGGTLLGAIRDKGFIPWDDDADLTVTRENYNKLKQIFSKNQEYMDMVFDTTSALPTQIRCKNNRQESVWLDIFIYDYISENKMASVLKKIGLAFFICFAKTPQLIKFTRVGEYKGLRYYLIYIVYLLGKLFPHSTKLRWKNWFAINAFTGSKKYMIRSNDQYRAIGLKISVEALDDYEMVPFEDTKFMVHSGYDEILRSSYGDNYMTPVRMADIFAYVHKEMRNW